MTPSLEYMVAANRQTGRLDLMAQVHGGATDGATAAQSFTADETVALLSEILCEVNRLEDTHPDWVKVRARAQVIAWEKRRRMMEAGL